MICTMVIIIIERITFHIRLSEFDLYIMALSELCLKGISLLSYLCGILLTSVQKLLKLDVILSRRLSSLPNETWHSLR
jgi:hypothetical protein